jgi:iron complex transport system ATP-binding protein
MVELRDVSWSAGEARILDGVTLAFRRNRFNVILGPNGAGKSTLLRIATGLLAPTRGVVRYDDRDVAQIPAGALARTRAVLSQHVELAFPLAVEDVVLMGRYPHYGRAPTARDRAIVAAALELVGMTAKRTQPYPTLSGGEQQKVQLARVLAQIWNEEAPREPKYLFLDEPTSSLDVHYEIHLLDIARDLLQRECTIIAILHDLNVALHYGDAFFVLSRGRLVAQTDSAAAIDGALIEDVFQVRAHRVADPATGDGFWRFSL